MDEMELEDDKSMVMLTPLARPSPEINDNPTEDDKTKIIQVSSIKQESPTILRASSMTSPTSCSSSITSILSSGHTLASKLSTNAAVIGTASPGLFSVKHTLLKPSSLSGISPSNKNVANVFAVSKSPPGSCPKVNTPTTCCNNIFSSTTCTNSQSSSCSIPTNPTTLWSGRSSKGLNTPRLFSLDPAIPGTSSLNPQVSAAGDNHQDGGSPSRIGSATLSVHSSFLQPRNAGNMDFSTWRKSASPTRGSRRPEIKRGMKGKHLKQLHHQIHYLKSYLSSYGATKDVMNQDNSSAGNQSGELPTFRDGILSGDASSMHSRMAKILKRKLRQRRSIERNLMYRGLVNGNSSSNRNTELLESSRNSTNPELSAPGSNSISSSTSSMNTADADACFFKSILPDMKTLNDARKLQFKFHIMGKLSELIAEQRRDLDLSSSSEQRMQQRPITFQTGSSIQNLISEQRRNSDLSRSSEQRIQQRQGTFQQVSSIEEDQSM